MNRTRELADLKLGRWLFYTYRKRLPSSFSNMEIWNCWFKGLEFYYLELSYNPLGPSRCSAFLYYLHLLKTDKETYKCSSDFIGRCT